MPIFWIYTPNIGDTNKCFGFSVFRIWRQWVLPECWSIPPTLHGV